MQTAVAGRTASTRIALAVAFAVFLVTVALGWVAWGDLKSVQKATEAALRTIAPEPQSSPAPSPSGPSEEDRRATVFKRMVAAMQDNRFTWRTVERLAIESGVEETEAHAILAEHPGEIVLGESREGKVIARLSQR